MAEKTKTAWRRIREKHIGQVQRFHLAFLEKRISLMGWCINNNCHWGIAKDLINGKLKGHRGEAARVKALLIRDFGDLFDKPEKEEKIT